MLPPLDQSDLKPLDQGAPGLAVGAGAISPEPTECYHFGMSSELSTTSASRLQRAWRRISDWLGLDRSEPADLLETDPARHFQEWDRDLPDPYAG